MSEFKEEALLFGSDTSTVVITITNKSVSDADTFHLVDVVDCPDESDQAAYYDDYDFGWVAHGALTVCTGLYPNRSQVGKALGDWTMQLHSWLVWIKIICWDIQIEFIMKEGD